MRRLLFLLLICFMQCTPKVEEDSPIVQSWKNRDASQMALDSLEFGKSYLSVYAQVYSFSEKRIHNLTSLVSLRNTSEKDTIFLLRAEYYDTKGNSVKNYADTPIYLAPLETIDILLSQDDASSGTGNNFIFEWKIPEDCPEPLFEAVMNSTLGQQGLSFTTQAKRIE